jgi:hypothetical protein
MQPISEFIVERAPVFADLVGTTPDRINGGRCMDFADYVKAHYPEAVIQGCGMMGHVWVCLDGLHYDSEHPDGMTWADWCKVWGGCTDDAFLLEDIANAVDADMCGQDWLMTWECNHPPNPLSLTKEQEALLGVRSAVGLALVSLDSLRILEGQRRQSRTTPT